MSSPPISPPPPDWLLSILAAFPWIWDYANFNKLVKLATLIGGGIGIYYLAIRTRAADSTARAALDQAKIAAGQAKTAADRHEAQTSADRDRRIIESFAKAGEQLGSGKLETRLVGIYTLERIAGESECEYWPIMETLTAFVRERAPWPSRRERVPWPPQHVPAEQPKNWREQPPPPTDIQAVLTVLGRRDKTAPKQYREEPMAGRRLDLRATDLRGARLQRTHLERVDFQDAHLEGAVLEEAHLEGAVFLRACLEGAHLGIAHLEKAFLMKASLQGANLGGAYLEGANLHRAHLEGAVGLTREQLDKTSGDACTLLPDGLTRPAYWSAVPEQPDNAK